MVYIDTNMVRAGVVSHPAMWPFCGYNEIQEPRRKNVLIVLEPSDEGGFTVYVPSLPGCISEGDTKDEAYDSINYIYNNNLNK